MTKGMKWLIVGTVCFVFVLIVAAAGDFIFSEPSPKLTLEEQYQQDYSSCVRINAVNGRDINECNKIRIAGTPLTEAKAPNPDVPPVGVGIKEYETEYAKKWEANKAQWLKENPPVEFLFDTERRMDKDYVLYYLKNNRIGGDCGLAFLEDVVCWSEGDQLQFPSERPALDKQ